MNITPPTLAELLDWIVEDFERTLREHNSSVNGRFRFLEIDTLRAIDKARPGYVPSHHSDEFFTLDGESLL